MTIAGGDVTVAVRVVAAVTTTTVPLLEVDTDVGLGVAEMVGAMVLSAEVVTFVVISRTPMICTVRLADLHCL